MGEYIERRALLETLNKNNIPYNADVNYFVMNAPTADVVEVVRCKDCKNRETENCPMAFYDDTGDLFCIEEDNDFCSYGERKEEKV